MLTPVQDKVLRAIVTHIDQTGMAPRFCDLLKTSGHKSSSGVHAILTRLEERGFIRRVPQRARGIEVLRRPSHCAATGPLADLLAEARMYVAEHNDTTHGAGLLARIDAVLNGEDA